LRARGCAESRRTENCGWCLRWSQPQAMGWPRC